MATYLWSAVLLVLIFSKYFYIAGLQSFSTFYSQAAHRLGWPVDSRAVEPDPGSDFSGASPARFWLFTLEALAFIRLRAGRPSEAACLLEHVRKLAPQAAIGDEAVAALLESARTAIEAPTHG